MITVLPVTTRKERQAFLSFPWQLYKRDPLWVPPLLSERDQTLDPRRGAFFQDGYAQMFLAWKDGRPAGTIVAAEDRAASRYKGFGECMIGFFECVDDYAVAEALLGAAQAWALEHGLVSLYGPYNLDIEDSRGILVEGWERPAALLCGHNPPYYGGFFECFGFQKQNEDSLAYWIDLDPASPRLQRLAQLAARVRERKLITVRAADFGQVEREIDIIVELSNRSLAHMPGFVPYTRTAVAAVIRPLLSITDPQLALFAEVDGKPAGFFPGVPNMNEVLIHLNGLRRPWDYLRLPFHMRRKPRSLSIKTVLVPPEYWDTGVAVLLFDELARRAASRGYLWADLSMTGEDNTDTRPLALHMGAQVYKRYRIYKKEL